MPSSDQSGLFLGVTISYDLVVINAPLLPLLHSTPIDVGFRFVQPLCFATLPASARRGSACSFLFLLLPFVVLLFFSCLAVSIFHIFCLLAHTLFVVMYKVFSIVYFAVLFCYSRLHTCVSSLYRVQLEGS